MALISGRHVRVTAGGVTVTYTTEWSMGLQPEIHRHRGASEANTTKYPGETTRAGSFACEADPADAAQVALMAGLQRVPLVLYEDNGTSHSLDALVWYDVTMPRDGKPMRSFSFEETA